MRSTGELELLVVGSGVAGLSAAVRAAGRDGARVGVLTKAGLDQATTRWAQGGVAAVLAGDPDSTDQHLADTLAAGAGLCDVTAARVLVDDGPGRVTELIALGARFDTDERGRLMLAREGGHAHPRIVHAGGAATGAEIERALVEAVRSTAAATMEGWFALDLIVAGGRCRGVWDRTPTGEVVDVTAEHVLLATGGAGQLYAVTTNPPEVTGDGIAMALRAGVPVADLEFVQFHPTALHHPRMPRPLLSEALRGHGAVIRDRRGRRFVDELAPRDVVARAIAERCVADGTDHVWLDATGLPRFAERFPTLAASLAEVGLDPARDWLPIAPAAHYVCGGVLCDLDGATTLEGLWVAGEVACTGVHGANRLASNSLLEGMVFGARVVDAVAAGRRGPGPTGALGPLLGADGGVAVTELTLPRLSADPAPGDAEAPNAARERLQRAMTTGAGVVRDAEGLRWAAAEVEAVAAGPVPAESHDPRRWEVRNLATVARALLAAARERTETRGAHTRRDHPDAEPAWCRRLAVRAGG